MLSIASHVQRHEPDVLEAVIRMSASIGKAIDPQVGFWTQVKSALPNFKLIARFSGWQWTEHNVFTPAVIAKAFIDYCKSQSGWAVADYIETPNEPVGAALGAEALSLYDRFMAECVIQGHYAGKEVIVGQFGSGNFTPDEWRRYFSRTIAVATHYGGHEYGWYRIWSQDYREGKGHAFRCLAVMEEIHKTNPNAVLHITECGVTAVVTGGLDVGYKTWPIEWNYWDDLQWYASQLAKYPFIKSMHPFGSGMNQDWSSFEIVGTSIIDQIREWNLAQEEAPVATLAVQYPRLYRTWVAEGGDPEGDFRRHLLGIGALPPTQTDLDKLVAFVQAGVQQVANVVKTLHPNP